MAHKCGDMDEDRLTDLAVHAIKAILEKSKLENDEPFVIIGRMAAMLMLFGNDKLTEESKFEPDEILQVVEFAFTEFLSTFPPKSNKSKAS